MTAVSPLRDEIASSTAQGQDAPAPPAKRRRAPVVLAGALIAAVGAVATFYLTRLGKEKTDDAQVEARISNLSPRIAGKVARVLVTDNQEIKPGEVVVELDDRDQQAQLDDARGKLDEANARLMNAEAQLALTEKTAQANLAVAQGAIAQAAAVTGSTAAQIDQAKADVAAAESRKQLARLERERSERLRASGAATQAEIDARLAADTEADAALAQARARVVSALANRSNSSGTETSAHGRLLAAQTIDEQVRIARSQVDTAHAQVKQAAAAAALAELQLEYTKIRAGTSGTVTQRSVEPGQLVSPDRMVMAIVDLSDTWIVANVKETQLVDIRPGQPVDIEVDAFPGTLRGHVDSIAAGTGARFSLLPPENASGNFIKVMQRIPIKVKIDDRGGHILRPGMSAEVVIHTR
jgi:membrane fusion protein (multidrug efflux system)